MNIPAGFLDGQIRCPVYTKLFTDLGGDANPMHPLRHLLEQMINTLLDAEMDIFLGQQQTAEVINKRNGKILKRVRSQSGILHIKTPRDRKGDFSPILIPKWVKEVPALLEPLLLCLYGDMRSPAALQPGLRVIYSEAFNEDNLVVLSQKAYDCAQSFFTAPIQTFYPFLSIQSFDIASLPWKLPQCPDKLIVIHGRQQNGAPELLFLSDQAAMSWSDCIESLQSRGLEVVRSLSTNLIEGETQDFRSAFSVTGLQKLQSGFLS